MARAILRHVLSGLLIGLLTTVAGAGPAAAGPEPVAPAPIGPAAPAPFGFTTWAELFAVQGRLNAAANRILTTDASGYAGIIAAPENRELRVYWKGLVPDALRGLASRLDVPVRFLPARFTHREMVAEAQRLAADPLVATVAPRVDGSGLAVTVTTTARRGDQHDVLSTARLPLQVRPGQRLTPLNNRQADTTPYWGGAIMASSFAEFRCSTGFAIWWQGERRMLTAGHCGANGNALKIGNANPPATVINDNDTRDILMLNKPAGQSFSGAVYVGPYNSSTAVSVGGAASDFVGNTVCTSGAASGEHCGIQVQTVDLFSGSKGPLTLGVHPNGACAAVSGDSGGPVISYRNDGRVDGHGTIVGGNGYVNCPGLESIGFNEVAWAPLMRPANDPQTGSLTAYDASLVTI